MLFSFICSVFNNVYEFLTYSWLAGFFYLLSKFMLMCSFDKRLGYEIIFSGAHVLLSASEASHLRTMVSGSVMECLQYGNL